MADGSCGSSLGQAEAAKCLGEVAAANAEVLSFVARLGGHVIGDALSRVTGDGYHRTSGLHVSDGRWLVVSIEDGHQSGFMAIDQSGRFSASLCTYSEGETEKAAAARSKRCIQSTVWRFLLASDDRRY
jgi:hypothetical protein